MKNTAAPLLRVHHLRIAFPGGSRPVVDDISFCLERGKTLGVIGESGSGKSLTGLAILGMLPGRARLMPGSVIEFLGRDLCSLGYSAWRSLRGRELGVVFQEPMSSLNPLMRVGDQVLEAVVRNGEQRGMTGKSALAVTESLFDEVGLEFSKSALRAYPHEYSGGMQQRVMIAMALAGAPSLLIADEPTSALDVTVQKQILHLLREARKRRNMAMLFISHDLDIVAECSHDVLVMRRGRCEEYGPAARVFSHPTAEYTRYLLQSRLSAGLPQRVAETGHEDLPEALAPSSSTAPTREEPGRAGTPVVLRLRDADIGYGEGWLAAPRTVVRKVGFAVRQGECLGIVGESGSGKSTLAKAVMGMAKLLKGDIELFGKNLRAMLPAEKREVSRRCQIVYQNTYAALNPRLPVKTILAEPLQVHGLPCSPGRIRAMLEEVGLCDLHAEAYPHQLSGGQRQRVNIARALALDPELVLCDEIVSALDVSVQSQILQLLREIQKQRGMSLVFISHDLRVIMHMADHVLVLKSGDVVEYGPVSAIWNQPRFSYTRLLLSSAPGLAGTEPELGKASNL